MEINEKRYKYRMPGEFEPHEGCIMIWPSRPGSWPYGAAAAREAFARVAAAIAASERVYMLAGADCTESARTMLPPEVTILGIETDDAWARDVAPTFVWEYAGEMPLKSDNMKVQSGAGTVNISRIAAYGGSGAGKGAADASGSAVTGAGAGSCAGICGGVRTGAAGRWLYVGTKAADAGSYSGYVSNAGYTPADRCNAGDGVPPERRGPRICGIDWEFNAWGGRYNGLYPHWERDDAAAAAICAALGFPRIDAHPFVLEGGSIHSDGEGTLMVTEACLLSPGRNPGLSRMEIEERLKFYLGAEKVLWLPHGIYGDETDEHVDNIAAFTAPGEVVLSWTEDRDDPQYGCSAADLEYLESERDACGRRIKVHKLPLPAKPVRISEEDLAGYSFEPGEDVRETGERLAASYANFYISNGAVVMPAFGDVNDAAAASLLGRLFPGRKVVQIPARDILLGGGNIHCITQQVPLRDVRKI